MKSIRMVGAGVAAAAAVVAVALPSSSQAAPSPFPTGCSHDETLHLAPLANINIKTCELAVSPKCAAKLLTLPPNALLGGTLTLCLPEITLT